MVASNLREYYENHTIRSFDEVIGSETGVEARGNYFCPWEFDRIRPLKKFITSHKIGPTSEDALAPIVYRLLKILDSIEKHGFITRLTWDGYPRVIEIVSLNGNRKYIIRDGNHRIASLSHLGWKSIRVCYERDHWSASRGFILLYEMIRNKTYNEYNKHPREIREDQVEHWPHVLNRLVSREDALKYFRMSEKHGCLYLWFVRLSSRLECYIKPGLSTSF